jgi:hypothetical protein
LLTLFFLLYGWYGFRRRHIVLLTLNPATGRTGEADAPA